MVTGPDSERLGGDVGQSLTERAYDRIKEEILLSRRPPEALLLEHELAQDYGVSKTPIREALRLLVNEGWVIVLPRRGYLVRPLRLEDVRDIYALRQYIEPNLVVEAARRSSPDQLAGLVEHIDAQQQARDRRDEAFRAGSNFHLSIARLASSARGLRILTGLLDEGRRLHHIVPALDSRLSETAELDDHRRIARAMADGDHELASKVMHEHLQESLRQIIRAFTDL
jgi:DNA-binding GntR family transcriptional regulator